MYKSANLNSLLQLAEDSKKQLNLSLAIFDETMNEAIRNVPDADKGEVERFKAISQQAINLAKSGKSKEAQELIKNFTNGR